MAALPSDLLRVNLCSLRDPHHGHCDKRCLEGAAPMCNSKGEPWLGEGKLLSPCGFGKTGWCYPNKCRVPY